MARNKKSQKAQAELAQLEQREKALQQQHSDSESEPEQPRTATFAAFVSPDIESEPEEQPQPDQSVQAQPPKSTPAKSKNKKKTRRKKNKPDPEPTAEPLDEVDAALQSLGLDILPSHSTPAHASSSTVLLRDLVSVDPKFLDPDLELRRMFGSSVISSVNPTSPMSQYSGARKSQAQRIMNVHSKAKSIFAKPAPTWPPVSWVKSGLSMDADPQHSNASDQWFTFQHNKSYKVLQYEFLAAVAASDVQALMTLLRTNPYHIDSLLVLADMSAQQGDPGQADTFTHQALYGMEGSTAPGFSFTNGTARLVFDHAENRAMFRALDKRVNAFMKRGTWRAACESAKALFALDPWADPYGALLHLEFLAVKAKQGSWLLQLLDHLPNIYNEAGVARDNLLKLNTYPGLAFARALILFDREDAKSGAVEHHKDSSAALTDAILTFPFVIPILFDKLGLNIPSAYLTHPRAGLRTSFDSSRPDSFLHLLGQLYVFRNESLFKPPEILEWLQSIVKQSESRLDDSSNESVRRGQSFADGSGLYGKDVVPSGILRHLVAADITQLRPHFPSGLLASITNTFDPLPPEGGSTYDDEYFRGVITSSATRGAPPATRDQLRAALERLLPQMDDEEDADPELQAAIQAQLDVMAHGQHGLPGGIPDVEDDEVVHQETEADATDTPDAQQQQGGWTAWAQSWLRLGGGNTRNPDPNHRADHEAE